MNDSFWWSSFVVVFVAMLGLDLGVFNRKAHHITFKEAALTSLFYFGVALAFNIAVFIGRSADSGLEFLTGYLVELALSVDNLFVFLVIFAYFRVAGHHQHRVLFWGIMGVLILRGTLIVIGSALIHQFEWVLYIFGAFLIYTAFKLATAKDEGVHPEKNPVISLFRHLMPVSKEYDGSKFFTRHAGKLMATPLLIILLVVETTDLVFALDSIPAIFAITTDPFIVFSSNVFAVLGLRALYFLLAGMLGMFRYLKLGLSFVLGFIGVKMLLPLVWHELEIPIGVSLSVIAGILAISIGTSLIAAQREGKLKVVSMEEAEREAMELNAKADAGDSTQTASAQASE
jgi:tellurite resistance protein TerC